jgi:preprotein translocase subunit SecF
MRIIGETKIPFLRYKWIALGASALVIVAGLAYELAGHGLNLGIDFQGGTQVTVKFQQQPDLGQLRAAVAQLGIGEPVIQRFDEIEKNEILIRVGNPEGAEGDFTKPILDLLRQQYNADLSRGFDLNTQGSEEMTAILVDKDPDAVGPDVEVREAHYRPMVDAVFAYRKKAGIFSSLDELDQIEGLSEPARAYIKESSDLGAFSLLGAESVGPAVGADLQRKARLAMTFSLLGMLVYIWIRFQLPYGIGAVVALFHDVLITLSALSLTQREINLPTIAALLTLVGYSVNDTVVVFDRVRENLRMRRGEDLEPVMNDSINQTLSRTLITSGTTLIVVVCLYLFGGDVINTFAFVLLVGILVGTYSSVFVASPVALGVNRVLAARRERRRRASRRRR